MHPDDEKRFSIALMILLPVISWFVAVNYTRDLPRPQFRFLPEVMKETPHDPILSGALLGGVVLSFLVIVLYRKGSRKDFRGAPFRRHYRGSEIVSQERLAKLTKAKGEAQITIAGIPVPLEMEDRHFLFPGTTGAGKSVLIREMAYKAFIRGDRMIVVDPNGDMYSKLGTENDVLLNPEDKRTQGWSIFNEIRSDYDYARIALCLVPRGKTANEEEWLSYARLMLAETMRKLILVGTPTLDELVRYTNRVPLEDLERFLKGTKAEALFVGAEKAIKSTRYVLADKLDKHLRMPEGAFSIRGWLDKPDGGNLYITWREDQSEALKPLISSWVEMACTSLLSMPSDTQRRTWLFLDELASLDRLTSLEAATTKGRKFGLRVVAGIQSPAQLVDIYGKDKAQTLRSCFRSLVVLSLPKAAKDDAEDLSQCLGEHEVERDSYGQSRGTRGYNASKTIQRTRERLVIPSEIMNLPDMTAYVAFGGELPICRATFKYKMFIEQNPSLQERAYA